MLSHTKRSGLSISYYILCYNEEGVVKSFKKRRGWSNWHEYLNALNNVRDCAPVPPYYLEFKHLFSCALIKATGSG